MKFNGATFNKAQQDQLKKKVGAELEAVVEKVNDIEAHSTIKKYTVTNPTDLTQLQALLQLLENNVGRIIAIYAFTKSGKYDLLSYSANTRNSSSYLELVSSAKIAASNEIQIKQITKSGNNVYDQWVSIINQSDNNAKIVVNGQTSYTSIEVYYL